MEGVKSQPPREAACRAASGSISQSEVRAYFDSVAPRWNELRQGYFPEEVRAEVIRRLAPHPDMRVADIGSGTGFLAAGLAPLVAEVHCIDSSPAMLEQAREGLKDFSNVRYNLSDGQSLPLAEGSFDAVVANMFLHHALDPASGFRRWLGFSGREDGSF